MAKPEHPQHPLGEDKVKSEGERPVHPLGKEKKPQKDKPEDDAPEADVDEDLQDPVIE